MNNNNGHQTVQVSKTLSAAEKRALLAKLLQEKAGQPKTFPLSFAQQRMWVLWQLDPASPAYNVPAAIRFEQRLEPALVEQALNAIVQRHETLRTTFALVEKQPVQIIAPKLTLYVPVLDLQQTDPAALEQEIQRLANAEAGRPFDLAQGPLLRASIIELGAAGCVLLLNMHHIVADGWSMNVLIREFATLYQAFAQGQPRPVDTCLPALPIQYVDYAVWQRTWLQGEVYAQQLAYWQAQLAGPLPTLELPMAPNGHPPRPLQPTQRGATQYFSLPQPLLQALKTTSTREGVTLYMTLLAAFKLLLHRYTGQTDIIVGAPIANRNRTEIEPLIGFFVNTLALRTTFADAPTFRALLQQVRTVVLGASANQDLPFDQLVNELNARTAGAPGASLFQVMFAFQENPITVQTAAYQLIDLDNGTSQFDLTWSLTASPQGLVGCCQYRTELFDTATIQRMWTHFQTLLTEIVAHPDALGDQPLSAYTILPAAEQQQLLIDWNQTQSDLDYAQCIHHLFEAQVEKAPDAVAVVFGHEPDDKVTRRSASSAEPWQGDKVNHEGSITLSPPHPVTLSLTYRQLNEHANQLAHYLRTLGVGAAPQGLPLVGICLERAPEAIVAMLAVLKAGGAYLPLDPEYPPDRLAFMVTDSHASVLITRSHLVERVAGERVASGNTQHATRLLCLDTDGPVIAQQRTDNPVNVAFPESLAYMIYTSGSTGRPKGTLLHHQGACNMALALARLFGIEPSARVLQFASFSFDASVCDILTTLLSGATLCLASREEMFPGPALTALMQREAVTTAVLPPSVLAVLPPDLPALQTVISAGEACTAEIIARWASAPNGYRRFLNGYGPTETTVAATVGLCEANGQKPLIGRPLDNLQVYILDQQLQPTPIGVPGELYVGGVGLAYGYHGRPDLTAERFIPNPFGQEAAGTAGTRLYKTGDRARFRPNGALEYLGRIDQQVKIRGFRIEVEEIEAVLRQHPTVSAAAIAVDETTPGAGAPRARLIAYLVADAAADLPPQEDLRAFLQERLPDYMIPSDFRQLAALPISPSGKVDRKALGKLAHVRLAQTETFAVAQTAVEEQLVTIWTQVLGHEPIGIHDNFFAIGGDSILAIQITAQANGMGLHITPKQLFEHPTIAGLAQVVGTAPVTRAEQGMVTGPAPLTPIQRWFFAQNLPDPHHWNQALLFRVQQPLNPSYLAAAVRALLHHHDALRLRFEQTEDGWRQTIIAPEETVPFQRLDLSALPATEQAAAMNEISARVQASLSLGNGPMLSVILFDCGGEDRVASGEWRVTGGEEQPATRNPQPATPPSYLLLVLHHLIVDGVSWRILLEDLQVAYQQLAHGGTVQLPAKTTSFQEWAGRLVDYAQSPALHQELAYWVEQGRTRAFYALPIDYPVDPAQNTVAAAATVSVALSAEETTALLHKTAKAYNTQINDLLLAALIQAVAEWTGQRTLWIDLEGHGREELFADVDLSRTVGWFTSFYPVPLALDEAGNLGEVLMSVKETLRAVPNRGIGYGVLRYLTTDETGTERLALLPRPQLSFNYLGQVDGPKTARSDSLLGLPEKAAGSEQSPRGQRPHLVAINAQIVGGQLHIHWQYSTTIHRRVTIERLAASYHEALQAFIAHCQAPDAGGFTPSDFPLARMTQAKLRQVAALIAGSRK